MKIDYTESYKKGAQLGLEVLDYFNDASIYEMSYFLVSHRTLQRKQDSVNSIFKALNFFLFNVIDGLKRNKYKFKINFCGELQKIQKETLVLINEISQLNNNSFDRTLNLLIAYSGSYNLYNNCSILEKIKDKSTAISESKEYNDLIKAEPSTLSKIEVVIRSSDYFRLSDAPILETVNSIFIVVNKLLPEITKNDIIVEIEKYIDWKKDK